jgi:glycosyltransferase involved in cell wall biosynthesis
MATSICFVGLDNYPVLNPSCGHEYFGGESVQQTLLARAFVSLGYRVSMVVKDHGQPQGEEVDGIRVWKTYADGAGIPVLRFVHPRMTSILAALDLADADVVYQSCAGMTTGLVACYCRRRGRRFIFRLAHDTDCIPGQQLIRFWRDRKIYEYGLRRADFIAAQGVHQVQLLRQHYHLGSTPINMAVEEPAGSATTRDIDVLWVNNLRDFKRPDLAVELARQIAPQRVIMIGGAVPGNARLYDEIKEHARTVSNLDFLGAVPYHDVNDYFARARVFLNTSDSEGFPNSFLQAWIRGVPVVSFFDPDGLIAGLGLGSVPADMGEMQRAVRALLGDEVERSRVGEKCRQYAIAKHSPHAVARQHVDLGALGAPVPA